MFVIGIAGGSGSGKTTVVRKILDDIPESRVALMPQDHYYRDSGHLPLEERQKLNFDHPDILEWELLVGQLQMLKKGMSVDQPRYSYLSCTRAKECVRVEPREVIIVEGILIFTHLPLVQELDLRIYVDADDDDRLGRIIHRDMKDRGRTAEQVLGRYQETVKPMHLQFIEPSKRLADVIVPQGGKNEAAVSVLRATIKNKLGL